MTLPRLPRVVVCAALCSLFACSSNEPGSVAAISGSAPVSAGAPGVAVGGTSSVSGAGGSVSPTTGGASLAGMPSTGGAAGGAVVGSDDLFGTTLAGELGAYDSAPHSLAPTTLWGDLKKPYPTNAWWENLVLNKGESPVNVLPYMVAATADGLRVCHPQQVVEQNYTFSAFIDNWLLGAVEPLGVRTVAAYDALSVTLQWKSAGSLLQTPLVEGMPYVSAHYQGLRPRLHTIHGVTSVNGGNATTFSSDRFDVVLDNGQTWRVYSSKSLAWSLQGQELQANDALDGWLRVARVGSPELGALLDAHAGSIPVGGSVSALGAENLANLSFDWQTEGSGEPLMMALAHHLPTLKTKLETASLATIRGPMRAVVGKQWRFEEPLTKLSWSAARAVPAERRAEILTALHADATALAPSSEEPYFFGKQVAAVARLALIADELGEGALAKELSAKVEAWLEPWLAGGAGSRLIYDTSWGGIVSRPGIVDAGADFGLGWYNDHHFQYGYFIYTAAVLAHFDVAWATSHRAAIEVVLRDYASPKGDSLFPAYRCKDWFVGHSWAAGIFEFADSRNQESTSEAVNGYYAVYLWGLAMNDARMRDLGRLMLTTEIRSAQTYWQIKDDSIYPEPFASGKIVGVLWATKADRTTWFGSQLEFVHGIQWMPFTPISEELLPASWISETYPLVHAAFTRTDPVMGESWRGLVQMAHAIIDPQAGFTEVEALKSFDDGNSRTNALYWAATR